MKADDDTRDVPQTTGDEFGKHDPIEIVKRVLGPLALELWGARKLRQLARELRRAEEWQQVRATDKQFEQFFAVYPRQEDKRRAAEAFRKARRRAGVDWPTVRKKIMAKAPRADETASEDYFVPLPSSWLRDERWEDEEIADAVKPSRWEQWPEPPGEVEL